MKIEGSIRSNLISAITSIRRWEGRPVHKDPAVVRSVVWSIALRHEPRSRYARSFS